MQINNIAKLWNFASIAVHDHFKIMIIISLALGATCLLGIVDSGCPKTHPIDLDYKAMGGTWYVVHRPNIPTPDCTKIDISFSEYYDRKNSSRSFGVC